MSLCIENNDISNSGMFQFYMVLKQNKYRGTDNFTFKYPILKFKTITKKYMLMYYQYS